MMHAIQAQGEAHAAPWQGVASSPKQPAAARGQSRACRPASSSPRWCPRKGQAHLTFIHQLLHCRMVGGQHPEQLGSLLGVADLCLCGAPLGGPVGRPRRAAALAAAPLLRLPLGLQHRQGLLSGGSRAWQMGSSCWCDLGGRGARCGPPACVQGGQAPAPCRIAREPKVQGRQQNIPDSPLGPLQPPTGRSAPWLGQSGRTPAGRPAPPGTRGRRWPAATALLQQRPAPAACLRATAEGGAL